MSTFKIYPLYLGRSPEFDLSGIVAKKKPGEKGYMTHGCLLLENNQTGEFTLLDCGTPSAEEVAQGAPYHYNADPNAPSFTQALRQHGITPADIHQAAVSHLHSDHCWNAPLLRKDAPIYVQSKEIQHAVTAKKPELWSYTMIDYPACPRWAQVLLQLRPIDGDWEIEPGLRAILTPGHTYGSQSFLIDTEDGPYIYVGDLYYCEENWKTDSMIAWYSSIDEWYQSHAKIQALIRATGAKILSIHNPATFDHTVYGG